MEKKWKRDWDNVIYCSKNAVKLEEVNIIFPNQLFENLPYSIISSKRNLIEDFFFQTI